MRIPAGVETSLYQWHPEKKAHTMGWSHKEAIGLLVKLVSRKYYGDGFLGDAECIFVGESL